MSAVLRYRREPGQVAARARPLLAALSRSLGRVPAPPGFRYLGFRLASGLLLELDGPEGPSGIRVALAAPEAPCLRETCGFALSVDGDDGRARAALPALHWVEGWLGAACTRIGAARVRALIAAACEQHEYAASAEPQLRPGGVAELRLLLACNQRCYFCNCDENAPNLVRSAQEARAALERLRRSGADILVVTGGEPTLHSDLVPIVVRAKAAGFRRVTLQTNSMLLGEGSLAADLARAGLDGTFASLHGLRATSVDRITGTPGGFARTLRGIEATIAAGMQVTLNFVATRGNLGELPAFVPFAARRFGAGLEGIVLSFMSPVASGRRNLAQMPRLSAAGAAFRRALEAGSRLGVPVSVAGVCGLPLCQVPGFESRADEARNPPGVRVPDDRRLGAACGGCAHLGRCTGFWRDYLDRYGDTELRPLARALPGVASWT